MPADDASPQEPTATPPQSRQESANAVEQTREVRSSGADFERQRRHLFGSLCSLVFLVNLARVVFAPLLEPLMVSFSVGEGTAGLVATLAWAGSALPRIPAGYMLTRISRQRVVLGTGVVLTLASLFTAMANSVYMLGAGAFLMGIASGAYFISANPLVSELYTKHVGRALGIHGTASQLAAVVAPLFVGAVLLLSSWRTVFLVIAAVALMATFVFYRMAKDNTAIPNAGVEDRQFLSAARRQWPIIVSAIAIVGATGLVWNGLFNFYVTYMTNVKALSGSTARTLLTVVFAAGVPAFWVSGRLADRLPYVPLMLSILSGFIVSLLALTAVNGLFALTGVTIVLGYVIHSLFPALDTYLLDSLPDENRASAYAMYSGGAMVVQALGSFVFGFFREQGYSYNTILHSATVGLVLVLVLLLVLYVGDRLPKGAN